MISYYYTSMKSYSSKDGTLTPGQNETLREFDRLNRQIDELYHEIAAARGLSDSAYDILHAILVLGEGHTQTDLGRYSCLNKQTTNSSVSKLQRDGLIKMVPGSGRAMRIHLTQRGRTVLRNDILPVDRAENEIFDEMSDEDRRTILRLTGRYLDSLRRKIDELPEKGNHAQDA